jgi:hypothetical protein
LDELTQSYDHLKLAAAHAAGGAAERFTPGYDRARVVASRRWNTTKGALSPLYEQIRDGAANARREQEMKRNKWPVVIGLVAAGAAAGAAGAMIARRRRAAAQWDEYEPMPSLEESPYADTGAKATGHRVTAGAASVADTVSSQAGKIADKMHEKARSSGTSGMTGRTPSGAPSTGEGTFAPFAEPEEPVKPAKATPKEPKTP